MSIKTVWPGMGLLPIIAVIFTTATFILTLA